MKSAVFLTASMLLGATSVFAASADTCLNCHEPDEYDGKTVEDVAAALANPENKNHRRVKDLTAEEIEAILKELQGG